MIPLPQIHIPTPCHESWEAMTGDARARFCTGCRKHVHNLSEMTRDEARTVLERAEEHICVRFFPGADGRPLTCEDRVPVLPVPDAPVFRTNGPRRLAAAASWVVAVLAAGLGCAQAAVGPKTPRVANPIHGQTKSQHRYRLGQFSLPKRPGTLKSLPGASNTSGFDAPPVGMGGFGPGPAMMGGMMPPPASVPVARLGEVALPAAPVHPLMGKPASPSRK